MIPGYRVLRTEYGNFDWYVGRSNVCILSPTGDKYVVDFSVLTGKDWYNIEHDRHKRNFTITPADIRRYLVSTGIIPGEDVLEPWLEARKVLIDSGERLRDEC